MTRASFSFSTMPSEPGGVGTPAFLAKVRLIALSSSALMARGLGPMKPAERAARPDAGYRQGEPNPGRRPAGEQDSTARQRQQNPEGGISEKVAAGSALSLQKNKRHDVAGRSADPSFQS